MTMKNHYGKMLVEIAALCGVIMIVWTVFLQLKGLESIGRRNLWQIILLGSTLVFRLESLVNFHQLEEHLMRLNYFISSVLSDITILVLFLYFTTGGKAYAGKGWLILIVYFAARGLFYTASYLNNLRAAGEINRKLRSRNAGL